MTEPTNVVRPFGILGDAYEITQAGRRVLRIRSAIRIVFIAVFASAAILDVPLWGLMLGGLPVVAVLERLKSLAMREARRLGWGDAPILRSAGPDCAFDAGARIIRPYGWWGDKYRVTPKGFRLHALSQAGMGVLLITCGMGLAGVDIPWSLGLAIFAMIFGIGWLKNRTMREVTRIPEFPGPWSSVS